MSGPVLESILTCPECAHKSTEQMAQDACLYFFECPGCGQLLKPLKGDCCVFCSYGSVACPPIQAEKAGAMTAGGCGCA